MHSRDPSRPLGQRHCLCFRNNQSCMKNRLIAAFATYAILAVLAGFTLDGGLMRNAVWVLLAGLAFKTYIAYRAGW